MPTSRAKSGVVVPHKLKWTQKLTAQAIYLLAKILMATWRCDSVHKFPRKSGPVIFCVWHNRLAISMVAYFRFAQEIWPAPGFAAMISASKDGGLLATVLQKFGVQPVRGSTSRRGRQALLESTTWLEKKFNIAITPDGPRGPRYEVQDGIISLAQVSGVPIVPVSAIIRGKITLGGWDRFQLPLPFARCSLIFGKMIQVPRDLPDADREALRQLLKKEMMSVTGD
ncbi:MAG: lysophospholipid acyltransferase family protein [Verrucomicrobiota bacterium]